MIYLGIQAQLLIIRRFQIHAMRVAIDFLTFECILVSRAQIQQAAGLAAALLI